MSADRFTPWEIGQALTSLLGAIGIAAALAGVGPWLDAQPDRRAEAIQADELLSRQRLAERWEREAREKCAAIGGDNTGYIRTAYGGIVCTDKRGRKIAQKGQP
jgi:hypothetical protein